MAPFNPDIPSDKVDPMKHNSTWALYIFPEGINDGKEDDSCIPIMH